MVSLLQTTFEMFRTDESSVFTAGVFIHSNLEAREDAGGTKIHVQVTQLPVVAICSSASEQMSLRN